MWKIILCITFPFHPILHLNDYSSKIIHDFKNETMYIFIKIYCLILIVIKT